MKRTVGILLFDEAEVLDFAGPFEVFSVASEVHNYSLFDVKTIGKTMAPIRAVNGLSVNPDVDFSSCPHIDLLVLPGGQGTRALVKDNEVMNWIQECEKDAEITMSVCSGSRMPGVLGLLDGKPYCTHHEVYDHMAEIVPTGIPTKDLRYVQCANDLYTSGGISAGIDLSFHIVERLHGRACIEKTARYMEYDLERSKS